MTEPVPTFRYHPDPVRTRAVVADDIVCEVCEQPRAWSYVGPYYTPDAHYEAGDPLCPWCIADGRAARAWQATFVPTTDLSAQARAAMSADALAELEFRTPSYNCRSEERWLDHDGEAAAYLGEVGAEEYRALPTEAQAAVRVAAGDDPRRPLSGGDAVLRLRADGDGPAVYLFRCLHCGRYDGFLAAA